MEKELLKQKMSIGKLMYETINKEIDEDMVETCQNYQGSMPEWYELKKDLKNESEENLLTKKIHFNLLTKTVGSFNHEKAAEFSLQRKNLKKKNKSFSILTGISSVIFVLFALALIAFVMLVFFDNPLKTTFEQYTNIGYPVLGGLCGLGFILMLVCVSLKQKTKKSLVDLNNAIYISVYDHFTNTKFDNESIKKTILDGAFNVEYISTKASKKILNRFSYPDISHDKTLQDVGFCYEYKVNGYTLELQDVDVLDKTSTYSALDKQKLTSDSRQILKPKISDEIQWLKYITFDFGAHLSTATVKMPDFVIFNYFNEIANTNKRNFKDQKFQDNDFDLTFKLKTMDVPSHVVNLLGKSLNALRNNVLFGKHYSIGSSSIWSIQNKMYAILSYPDKKLPVQHALDFNKVVPLYNSQTNKTTLEFEEAKLTDIQEININLFQLLYAACDLSIFGANMAEYLLKTVDPLIEFIDLYKSKTM
ncbi:hypothetical protein KQ874_01790 [Mycoplasma sp. ES3157-GEN-MYC]|uniref:Uncharacterized protein n=1 Tax=Mycoplasma miroungigenitalium TaxID=754515 RepID=A0A6M4J939_9MOLU|nr:hypothetical protein [Mycoplasma miroungigenitalium]MBU4690420.1 hypothetical protein [Mycoplasma miroungigenitalium]MBU4691687.1 hypothetical protein [Mycoplasma miroungigenitalium]QJR43514.1 hypothetical protein HLA87_01785 [Mycoplasma miroungigenitalium]